MDYSNLSVFVSVVEAGSFTKAAEVLSSSKSRVSQQISQLEKTLGVQLLHRTTRSIRPTEIGLQIYEQCKLGFDIIDQTVVKAIEAQHSLSGKIRMSSVGGKVGEELVAPIINQFMTIYPNVQIELEFGSPKVDLFSEHYDLALRMGKLEDSTLVARPLQTLSSHVCASQEYLDKYGVPLQPKDLKKHRCICGSLNEWPFSNDGKMESVKIDPVLKCGNGKVMRDSALQHQGIVRLHGLYLIDDIQAGRLVEILQDWHVDPHPVALVYPKSRFGVKRIKALVDFILEQYALPY